MHIFPWVAKVLILGDDPELWSYCDGLKNGSLTSKINHITLYFQNNLK